eukprot:8259771-Karenia_brevis.AAC.1
MQLWRRLLLKSAIASMPKNGGLQLCMDIMEEAPENVLQVLRIPTSWPTEISDEDKARNVTAIPYILAKAAGYVNKQCAAEDVWDAVIMHYPERWGQAHAQDT